MSAAEFDLRAEGRRVSNWGRWGSDDQRGTLNLITDECVAAAAQLVRTGQVFSLGVPLDENGPQGLPGRMNPKLLVSESGHGQDYPGGLRWADDYIFMPLQAGTQWDALSHVWYDDVLFNGFPASSVGPKGAPACSVTALSRGIVGRGVLLDVARHLGVPWLEPGYVIEPELLDHVARRAGVELRPGDIVLIRTGWWLSFLQNRDAVAWMSEEPGLGVEAAAWIREHDSGALGMDNWGIEVVPGQFPDVTDPVHCLLLRDVGVPLGEIFDLEKLAAQCEVDGRYEFLFCAPPLNIPGAAGSPVNPLAIK